MVNQTPYPRSSLAFFIMLTISLALSMSSSIAAKPLVPWGSVKQINSGKHQGIVTSTFVQPDPSFSGQFPILDNLPSFTNTANQTVSPNNLTGLNIPSLGQGLFPATGQFVYTTAFYSVPGTSKVINADQSLTLVVQTDDGLYHATSFVDNQSVHLSNNNGRVNWLTTVFGGDVFAPKLGNGSAGRVRKEAIVFSGPPNSSFDSINQIFPPALIGTASFIFIQGTKGYLADNPLDPNTKANFSVKTTTDNRFNFAF